MYRPYGDINIPQGYSPGIWLVDAPWEWESNVNLTLQGRGRVEIAWSGGLVHIVRWMLREYHVYLFTENGKCLKTNVQ